jgi:FAD/FMN-containing dehydrogenase
MEGLDRRELLARGGALALAAGLAGAVPEWALAAGPTKQQLRRLQHEIRGSVVTPGEHGYKRARALVNTRYDDVHPAAIVFCESAGDVQKTVRWARHHRIHLVPRAGRHSYGGYSTTRGVVADVSRLGFVQPHGHTAKIGAGAILIDIYSKLWHHGHRTIPGGSCPTVGIAGLAQGGGVGYTARKFGLTCDSIKELSIVTADGKKLVCSPGEHADLFWAVRGGGGGNFGIVTSFLFKTHAVGNVSTFFISWPWSSAAHAVAAWQHFAPHAPGAFFSDLILSSGPQVSAQGQFLGSPAKLRRLLRPLRRVPGASLSVQRRTFMEAALHWANCSSLAQCSVLPRETFKAKSDYLLRPMSHRGIKTMLRGVEKGQAGSLAIILDSYGGAINKVPKSATAFVHRDALYSIQYYEGFTQSRAPAALRFIRDFYASMRPFVSGFAYQNYIDPDLRNWPHAYYGSNYPRLRHVKRKYDPHNVFHFTQSIRP